MSQYSTPPFSPLTSCPSPSPPPILPHHLVAAAHALAPLDDLHLAHLVHSIEPLPPTWSFQAYGSDSRSFPSIESNDRLRTDELADLSAPEAERLHAAYDIEDHLDSSPDRLLVFGPSTPLSDVLEEVRSVLENKEAKKSLPTSQPGPGMPKLAFGIDPAPRYNREAEVYVARPWIQPFAGPAGCYKWEKGGADLIRFEMCRYQPDGGPTIINWSPVEVALSQALEVGHQLLALLHLRQFDELLSTVSGPAGFDFRPIDPIIWLVDPAEYAHAQLRETTEWGWSEHHVERHHVAPPSTLSFGKPRPRTRPPSTEISSRLRQPLSRSRLSQEIRILCQSESQTDSPSSQAEHGVPPTSNLALSPADHLPDWLDDLLVQRLPRILARPDACFSHELLHFSYQIPSARSARPASTSSQAPSRCSTSLGALLSPLEELVSPVIAIRSPLVRHTPRSFSSPFLLHSADMTRANSVHSTDLHYIPDPIGEQPRADGNPLKYYPCKACAEHAFKIALSYRLNEMKGKGRGAGEHAARKKRVEAGGGTGEPIGLGLKGRAVKEAMDREDDEFLTKIGSCVDGKRLPREIGPGTGACGKSGRLGWDEGEALEDVEG